MTPPNRHPAGHDNDNALREDDLQAYVDGQLELRRLASVEAYLANHPAEAARVAAYRLQIAGLHALFGPRPGTYGARTALPPALALLACELDAHLRQPAQSAAPPRHRPRRASRRLAAAVALLLTAGAATGLALTQPAGPDGPLIAASRLTLEWPLQPAAGLATQPGSVPLRTPDLAALGFRLVAQRAIDKDAGPPATQLLYQDAEGQRVTLSMRAGGKAGQTSFTFRRDGAAAQFLWQDEHLAYSLIGRMDEARLLSIAETVSRSLRGDPQDPAHPAATLDSAGQTGADKALTPPLDSSADPQAGAPPTVPLPERTGSPKDT